MMKQLFLFLLENRGSFAPLLTLFSLIPLAVLLFGDEEQKRSPFPRVICAISFVIGGLGTLAMLATYGKGNHDILHTTLYLFSLLLSVNVFYRLVLISKSKNSNDTVVSDASSDDLGDNRVEITPQGNESLNDHDETNIVEQSTGKIYKHHVVVSSLIKGQVYDVSEVLDVHYTHEKAEV